MSLKVLLKVLTSIPLLLLLLLMTMIIVLLSATAASAQDAAGSPEVTDGDRQLLMAFNAAFHELVASGEYDQMLAKWGLSSLARSYDQCLPTDSIQNQWPETPVGSFKTILETTNTIIFGHINRENEPFWNGDSGLEDDLAKEVTARIGAHYNVYGLRMRWMNPTTVDSPAGFFQSLYQNLESYGSDIILSAVTIRPQRAEIVDFTCAYLKLHNCILRSELDPDRDLTTLDQLNSPDVQVVVVRGTIYETYARQNLTNANLTVVGSSNDAFLLVTEAKVHVMLNDELTTAYALDNFPNGTCADCSIHPYGSELSVAAFLRKPDSGGALSESLASTLSSAITSTVMVIVAAVFVQLIVILLY